jgi:hypothetical protein
MWSYLLLFTIDALTIHTKLLWIKCHALPMGGFCIATNLK